MKKYKGIIIGANLIFLLAFFNTSIFKKEDLLKNGRLILLELAPVDPRSLIQGDFMSLQYAIANDTNADSIPKRGFCVVKLDSMGIAKKVRMQEKATPIKPKEFLIKYAQTDWRGINIGAESYFFQEGQAEKYDSAKYGGIKVDDKGNSVLIGLFDEERRQL